MKLDVKARTAAEVLVDQLVIQGVRHVFCVPGESYLPVLDALIDRDIAVTVCRQEGGAAIMAEAVGKLTGRPGVCFVTRGPGATNAAHGIHIAQQSSSPMIMFVGQVDREVRGRDAWQELDYAAVFGSMTKWAGEIDDPSRVSELVARAFRIATSGRPGPVVLALPEDMLRERVAVADAPPAEPVEAAIDAQAIGKLMQLLADAKSPVLLLGGSRWDEEARAAIIAFAERFHLPVATGFRRLPLFDPLHPNYAGDLGLGANPKLVARVKAADLVIVLGERLSEVTTQGYTLWDIPAPQTKLVHIYPEASEIGRVWQPHLAINATPRSVAPLLANGRAAVSSRESVAAAHAEYLAWSETATPQPGAVNLGEIVIWLRQHLPEDAILTNGAGNFAAWVNRYYRVRRFGGHLGPNSGSMGYGVPAAVAMQRLNPGRRVVAVSGDGDFLMNGQEFATAVQYGLPIMVLVCDNGSYGTIRMHQEREYPGRVIATELTNPDFAAYARAFGGFGATVEKTADFGPAFEAAVASGLPSILHIKIDTDAISPGQTLSAIRSQALAKES
ncbi:MAG TPA: thiamine pyrophosphate-binding protein [Caulobacteraceae bacterium]|jgi:acetolactate synthase-1/2/3 large subunit|nr:thiamine pyrophosphate-binding protein [Caulobacteraceae bacterium]